MRKRKNCLVLLLAFFMVITNIAGRFPVYAQNEETSGYQMIVEYDEEQNTATIRGDASHVAADTTIKSINASDGTELDVNNPEFQVTANGKYQFTISYQKIEQIEANEIVTEEREETLSIEVTEIKETKNKVTLNAEYELTNASEFEQDFLTKETVEKFKGKEITYNGWQLMELDIVIPKQDGLTITEIIPQTECVFKEDSTGLTSDGKQYKYQYFFYENGSYNFDVKYTLNGAPMETTLTYTIDQLVSIKDIAMRHLLLNEGGFYYQDGNRQRLYLRKDSLSRHTYWGFGQGSTNASRAAKLTSLDGLQYTTGMTNLYIFPCSNIDTIKPLTEGYYPYLSSFRPTEISKNRTDLNPESYTPEMLADAVRNMPNINEFSANGTGFKDFTAFEKLNGKLGSIKCRYNDIKTLKGIEFCPNLQMIYLAYNDISSIKELSALKDITFLELTYNHIFDLSPLNNSLSKNVVARTSFGATSQTIDYSEVIFAERVGNSYKIELPMPIDIDGSYTQATQVKVEYDNEETKTYAVTIQDNKSYIQIPVSDTVNQKSDNAFESAKFTFDFNNSNGKDNRTKNAFAGTVTFKATSIKEEYGVLYEFKSGTRGASLPDAVTAQLPLDEKQYAKGEPVTAIQPKITEIEGFQNENVANSPKGIWKFEKYDADSKVVSDDTLKPGKDPSDSKLYVQFTGTWKFYVYEYDINYDFISTDSNKTLPEDVMKLKPATETDKVTYGKTAKPSVSSFKDVKDDDGTWVFKGWDKEKVDNVTSDVTFTGTWDYVPNKHKVTYKFKADGTDKDLPESITEQLPKEEEHIKGNKVTSPVLRNDIISVEDGVWTFDGWDQDEVTVGTEDITITGTWSFEAHKYTVSYEFKSASEKSLPKEITDMLPSVEIKVYGTKVTPATLDAERVEVTDGVWLFKGWSPEKIDKLTKDEMFVGTWKYYPYQAIKANDLTVYEGGLGSNNSTETGDALPEPTWKAEISGHTVTVGGEAWNVEKQGLPFTWSYLDENGKKVTASATVGTYGLYVYPKEELKGTEVIIDDTYALKLPEKGLKVSEVKVRDVTNNTHADSLSTETFKNVYNYVSPKEEAKGFAGILSRLASLFKSEDSALNGTFDTTTGTHTDECDPNEPHAHVYTGTTFLKNGEADMPVGENAKIGLLWDDLLSDVLGSDERMAKLHEKSLKAISDGTFDTDGTIHKEFKYVDLVDMTDGNVWVGTVKNDVTVYYPYPKGVTKDSAVAVMYYDGLTRDYTIDMDSADLDDEISNSNAYLVKNLRKTDTGILFDVPSRQFGPIEIMWQKSYTPTYEFISGTEGKEVPEEVTDLLEDIETKSYVEGTSISAPEPTTKEIKVADGVWTFQKWDADSKVSAEGVKFTGTWTFAKNTSVINHIPVITAEDKIFTVGDPFSDEIALKDVTAYDEEDGDVTSSLKVINHNVDTSVAGTYFITYKATDSKGASSIKTITVTVLPTPSVINQIPVITAEDKVLTVGDSFDSKKDVTAIDKEDGDITDKIEIINNTVDISKAGTYTVTYKVTDKDGASTTKTIYVTVNPKMEGLNEVPVINAEDKTLTVGDSFDPRKDVTASDKEDGDITDRIEVIKNTVNTSKAGTYAVTYKVIDKAGGSVTKTITVTVKEKEKEEQPVVSTKPDNDNNDNDKSNTASNTDKPDASVKTGSSTNILLWSMAAIISLAGAITALLCKRKRSE